MTDTNPKLPASKRLLILGILLVLAIIVSGAMLLGQRDTTDALPVATDTSQTDEPVFVETPEVATDESGNAVPSTVEENAPAGETVVIDVDQAFAARTVGSADAPIKIIEYASLTCSHCAHFHNDIYPQLKAKYIDTGKVQFEFREFPLNDPALKGALTARCLPADKYESFVGLLFKTQEQWAGGLDYMASLKQNAKLAGMSDDTFESCHAQGNLKLKLADAMQVGKEKWNISSTPTFIINDGAEIVSGAQPLAEFERIFRKLTNDAVGATPTVE